MFSSDKIYKKYNRSFKMKGIQIFTDKNHTLAKQEIFSSVEQVARAELLEIGDVKHNGFLGMGVAITGASCYNLSLMKAEDRRVFLENIYGKDGIGLSIGRLCIGSSDYAAELYSYAEVPNDMNLEHFSTAKDEEYIIPIVKEILEINPELYLFASPWSPPGWMKTGGSMCGGYMRNAYLECYANYIVKFVEAYAKHGIRISAITPQNETNTDQNGKMPACRWHPETEAEFIQILHGKFEEKNLDVKIWMFDHNFSDADRVLWSLEECEGLAECCDGVAFHYYSGSIEETRKVMKAFPKLEMHFTEGGPRLYDHYDNDWCKWGIMATKALHYGYQSFTGWNLMLNEMGGPNIGPFWCGGFATRNSITGELTYSGQYKAYCHISPYLTPNSDIYPVSVSEFYGQKMSGYPKFEREVTGFAVDNHDGKLVMVLVNPNEDKVQTKFYKNGSWWYVELLPDSVSTLVIA
jgi:glucosylceramidase